MTASASATDRRRLTAIRAARLFDGVGLRERPIVIVDGATIVAIDAQAVPEGADVVDLGDTTLLPGFVDSHVHTVFDASEDPVGHLAERDDAAAFAAMTSFARTAARGGVTTMRDLGDRGFLSLGLRAHDDPGLPTLQVSGPPITTPGGHCHFLGEPASGVPGIRRAIRERAERGVDIIKIMASGGNLTPGSRPELPQYGPEELRAAVEEAHAVGLAITAHAHAPRAIVDALAAGVDGFEHLSFFTADGVDPIPDAVLAELVAREVTIGLTMGMKPVPGATPPPAVLNRIEGFIANSRRLVEAGARVLAGTDAGLGPIKPPDAIRYSIGQLQSLGLTMEQALHTVTARAATALQVGSHKGRLAPGYDADIVVLDGDPFTDPEALHRVRGVYVRGAALSSVD
jgi:imidazolonepropionase-like amidohydrolase